MVEIIRNDDVGYDLSVKTLKRFCNLCDKYGFKVLQGITLCGRLRPIDFRMTDEAIKGIGVNDTFFGNCKLVEYLKSRNDEIAVHGLWHTHKQPVEEIHLAKSILTAENLVPKYFIPPFNEGEYGLTIDGLIVSGVEAQNIEYFLFSKSVPKTTIAYTHSWRYERMYDWKILEDCLERMATIV